jgi:hypothetical protein
MTKDEEYLATKEIILFLDTYAIKNDQGVKLDFTDHKYLLDIYEDFTPKQAILKAAQIGFSTTANIKAMWLAKNKGMDIIYSLPSASDIKDFVSGKTNRLINNNPILQEWTNDKDSIEQKRVGNNVIYFKGTWTERAAIATPADLYISDETDRSKQEIVTQFQTRLQHSKWGWEWYFSNPSVPGMGVDKHWAISDQKHWFVTCDCGNKEYMTMNNIMGESPYFGCTKCRKELNRRRGQWVRRWQDKEVSGYWIPSFVNPNLTAKFILDKKKELSEDQFTNYVLGQPYIGKGNVLTKNMFTQNLRDDVNPQDTRPIIGVDTGIGINYVIANKYGTFFHDKVDDYGPIRNLLIRWPNAIAVIDQGGDIIGPRKLREEFPNRVFLCFFRASSNDDKLVRWNDEDGTVTADRDRLIQLVVDEFIEKRMPVYGTENDWYDYMIEWLGMYRAQDENALGIRTYHWEKPSSGRCDYPFAQVYARIGLDRFLDSKSTFHDPSNDSFASVGMDVTADGKTFLPKL